MASYIGRRELLAALGGAAAPEKFEELFFADHRSVFLNFLKIAMAYTASIAD